MSRLTLLILFSISLLLTGGTVASAATSEPPRPMSCSVDGPLAPGGGGGTSRKMALGIAQPNGRDLAALDAFSDSIGGRMPAIWAVWSQWGLKGTRDFPARVAEGLAARGVTPMIWWEPVDPSDKTDATYPRHRNISRGDHDAYIRRFARDARAFGGTVLLRFAHEANGSYFPWSVERFDNSPATFVAAWRHVHRLFAEEGATNVRFLWSVAKQSCPGGCNPYTAVYPGDAHVDILGLSTHNWGAMKDNWVSMYEGVKRIARHLAEISDKPLVIAEMASSGEGGDKPAWIREGYREVYERIPRIAAIVYLDADLRKVGHPDWRLSSHSGTLAAYAEIAALAEFSTSALLGSLKASRVKVMHPKGGPSQAGDDDEQPLHQAQGTGGRGADGDAGQLQPLTRSQREVGLAGEHRRERARWQGHPLAGPCLVAGAYARAAAAGAGRSCRRGAWRYRGPR